MSPWRATPPKDDSGYFERLTTHLFSAGLNWKVVEGKKRAFYEAFARFSPAKVAKFGERDVKRLMGDTGIVRNEKKIRATIHNAAQFLDVQKEYGSFKEYLDRLGRDEAKLQTDITERFHHVGPSTARMFLWSVGFPLKPTKEEKEWMASHEM
ncbi:MAG TPA: DNA-3-methyladenine glycosylase I [Nitrososphaerales archaeon]|nr:DNA-3-methyladenine glycosylase I [Nitrososphaerales archaeon]